MTADNGPETRYNLCMAYQGSFQEWKGAYHHVREKTEDTLTNIRTHTGNLNSCTPGGWSPPTRPRPESGMTSRSGKR